MTSSGRLRRWLLDIRTTWRQDPLPGALPRGVSQPLEHWLRRRRHTRLSILHKGVANLRAAEELREGAFHGCSHSLALQPQLVILGLLLRVLHPVAVSGVLAVEGILKLLNPLLLLGLFSI